MSAMGSTPSCGGRSNDAWASAIEGALVERIAELEALLAEVMEHDARNFGRWTTGMKERVRAALEVKP